MARSHTRRAEQDAKADARGGTVGLDFQMAPRAAQALRLRRLGYTYAQIAERCGYANESGARKAIKQASGKIVRDEARELIGWQLDMLDQALQVVMTRIATNDSGSLWAVDRLTPLLKRQAELMGLDKKDDAALMGAKVVVRAYPAAWVNALPAMTDGGSAPFPAVGEPLPEAAQVGGNEEDA